MTTSSTMGIGAKFAAAVIVISLIAAAGGYWFGNRHGGPAGSPPASSAAGEAARVALGMPMTPAADKGGRKVLYWHDPMVPGQRFDKPGKSPFMDMDLVPVYADSVSSDGGVTIDPRLVQNFGIRTVVAKSGTLDNTFTAVGAVGVDERGLVAVQTRSAGFVERLYVRAQYDPVTAGAPLAMLYVPDWLAAEEEYLALKASPQPGAQAIAEAARQRLSLLGVPDAEIARVERERKPNAHVTIPAPQSGVVWEIGVRDGVQVTPGTTLFKLATLDPVWVVADVPEAQAAILRAGAPVIAHATAFPDRAFPGTVNTLLPEVNVATRTVRARIVLANPGGALKPGMFATIAFGGGGSAPAVLVPASAVIRTGKRNVVLVDGGGGKYTPVDVEVGRESADLVEIRRGLAVGQNVVISGQFLVDSEANLRSALARMTDDGKPGASAAASLSAIPGGASSKAGSADGVPTHAGEGTVQSIAPTGIAIAHGAIPSARMGAMTMVFKPPIDGVPKGIATGTRVGFVFVLTPDGEMTLKTIRPIAPETRK